MYPQSTSGLQALDAFIVPNTAAYTSKATVEAFTLNAGIGEIGIFHVPTNTLASTSLVDGEKYKIYQKLTNTYIHTSKEFTHFLIDDENNTGCRNACDFALRTPQTDTLTVTASALAKGEVFSLKLIDTVFKTVPYHIEQFDFVSVTGLENPVEIATKLYQAWLAYETAYNNTGYGISSRFNVSVAGAVLTITAKDPRTQFETLGGNDLDGRCTVANLVSFIQGGGYYEEIYQIEREGFIFNEGSEKYGNLNRFDNWGKSPVFSKEGCTYDTIKLMCPEEVRSLGYPFRQLVIQPNVIIAIQTATPNVSGSAAYATLKTILSL